MVKNVKYTKSEKEWLNAAIKRMNKCGWKVSEGKRVIKKVI